MPSITINNTTRNYNALIYVNPNTGDDTSGTGSQSLPYKSIQKAVASLAIDNTGIILAEGVYNETLSKSTLSTGGREYALFIGSNYAYEVIGTGRKTSIFINFDKQYCYVVSLAGKKINIFNMLININNTYNAGANSYNNTIFSDGVINTSTQSFEADNVAFRFSGNYDYTRGLAFMNYPFTVNFNNCFIDMGYGTASYTGYKNSGATSPVTFTNTVFQNMQHWTANNATVGYSPTLNLNNSIESNSVSGGNNITRTNSIVQNVTSDNLYNITNTTAHVNAGVGTDPDGSVADIGVYGGSYAWSQTVTQQSYIINATTLSANNIWYVDPNAGYDNQFGDGSANRPFLTVSKAISSADVNDIIVLYSGVHKVNDMLNLISTTKNLKFVGRGVNSIVEFATGTGTSSPMGEAYFYDMVMRPSYPYTGETRFFLYTNGGSFKLRFNNVVFNRSTIGNYPTAQYFAWVASGTANRDVIFQNCSSVSTLSFDMGASTQQAYINSSFGGVLPSAGTKTTSIANATYDAKYRITSTGWQDAGTGTDPNGTIADIGVYGGDFAWLTDYNDLTSTITIINPDTAMAKDDYVGTTDVTPPLTTNNAPAPFVVSASTINAGTYDAWKAFNNAVVDTNDAWITANNTPSGWIKFDFGLNNNRRIGGFGVRTRNSSDYATSSPKLFILEGSMDDVTYTTIASPIGQTGWSQNELRKFTIPPESRNNYRFYKLTVSENNSPTSYTAISEIELYDSIDGYANQIASSLTVRWTSDLLSTINVKSNVIVIPDYFTGTADITPPLTSRNTPSPYVASASSVYNLNTFDAWRAFSNTSVGVDDVWSSVSGTVTGWIKFDFGVNNGKKIGGYGVRSRNGSDFATSSPKTWILEGSNDDVVYTTIDTQASQINWVSNELRQFTIPTNMRNTYRYYRLNISANNGNTATVTVNELELYDSLTGYGNQLTTSMMVLYRSDLTSSLNVNSSYLLFPKSVILSTDATPPMTSYATPSPYAVSASSEYDTTNYMAWKAFNNTNANSTDGWIATNGVLTGWLKFDFGVNNKKSIAKYAISARNDPNRNDPKDWTFEGSNDNVNYTVLDTKTGVTGWSTAERREYTFSNTTAYRFYRLSVSASTKASSGNYLTVGELEMYEVVDIYAHQITSSMYVLNRSDLTGTINANSPHVLLGTDYNLSFDGTNYASAPHSPSLDLTGSFTLESWVNFSSLGKTQGIIEKYNNVAGYGGYAFRVQTDNKLYGYLVNGTANDMVTGKTVFTANKWYHVAMVYDNVEKTLKLYVNGILDNTIYTTKANISSTVPLRISAYGDNATNTSDRMYGSIDETKIWNVARTQSDINDTMYSVHADLVGNESGLVGYWKFNEGSGTTAQDLTPNKNNITWTTGITYVADGTEYSYDMDSSIIVPIRSNLTGSISVNSGNIVLPKETYGKVDITPAITSNNVPYPYKASASSIASVNYDAWKVFDNAENGYWSTANNSPTAWLKFDYGFYNKKLAGGYGIRFANITDATQAPNSWVLEGSNDDVTYTVLDTQMSQTGWSAKELRTFSIPKEQRNEYRLYRLSITKNNGHAGYIALSEIELYDSIDVYASQKQSFIIVPYTDNLTSTVYVNPSGKMSGTFAVTQIYQELLQSTMLVKQTDNMVGSISVPPSGKMTAIFDVVPPPVLTATLNPIKDAFVREGVPRLNYGTEQDMFIGYSSGNNERYRTFIQFDVSAVPENMKIKTAKLKLYHAVEDQIAEQMDISTVIGNWTENGITWQNQPINTQHLVNQTLSQSTGYITIDVLSIFNEWYTGQTTNNGFMLKAVDETIQQFTRFFTRESANYQPVLEVQYVNPAIMSFDHSDVTSNIIIRQNKGKDLTSKVFVKSTWTDSSIVCTIRLSNILDSTIQVSRPDTVSSVKVRVSDKSDITGTAIVRVKKYSEIDGSILVSRDFIIGNIATRRTENSELIGTIVALKTYENRFPSSIIVTKPDLVSSIVVKTISDLPSTIIVNLNSMLNGTIRVKQTAQKDLNTTIRVNAVSELNSNIIVRSGYLASSISVKYRSDKKSTIQIRVKWANDFSSSLVIARKNGAYVFIM